MLGLTITTGSLVSIPFLFYSDWILKKIGVINVFILALTMYGVRYVGYSFITCAWYAFPFEALEVFTLYLMRVAQAQYIKVTIRPSLMVRDLVTRREPRPGPWPLSLDWPGRLTSASGRELGLWWGESSRTSSSQP